MLSKRGTMGKAATAMVATSHALSTKMGLDILNQGGNAFDAYVAAVLTDDLVLPGVTSTAGLTGLLVYQASTKARYYVDGPLKAPATWNPGAGGGAAVMVPGEVSALALAAKQFGKLPLSSVVAPVANLAAQGFAIDALYAASIQANAPLLQQSAYGSKTFFVNGQPLAVGATLAQPDYAATLNGIASQGASYFYQGAWASEAVAVANAAGGALTSADFASYQAFLVAPLILQHGAATIFTSSGYSNGGARLLLALQTLVGENAMSLGRFDQSPEALELLLRVQAAEDSQTWLGDPTVLSNPDMAASALVSGIEQMVALVSSPASLSTSPDGGSHSSAVIVVDAEGNVAVGTHTIETTNWGLGLFAGGIPLSTAGTVVGATPAGAFAMDPLSSEIALVGGVPALAMTTYGSGLHPGDVQIMSYLLDYGMDPEDAILEPRVGGYALSFSPNGTVTVDPSAHVLDERVPASVVCPVRAAGFGLEQYEPPPYVPGSGMVDTGFPTVVTISPTSGPSRLQGMTPEWMNGVAAGF
jgi:gamma-glutamyltranspeptidase/glutathione hydrolase